MSRSFKDCVSSISFSSSDKILLISVNEKKGCLDRKCGNQGKFDLCHLEVFIITTIDIKIEMPFSCAMHSLSWFSMLFCLTDSKFYRHLSIKANIVQIMFKRRQHGASSGTNTSIVGN